ncbi:unnamed protein product [Owenia fusiformis]|uniref:Uncharacterized protein n=1 Tax=Owenia fusiformis TaxID=6347 RepID=A0A8J1UU18_OWEFU|nr:unnamed protein product [Owenia fusiformis]
MASGQTNEIPDELRGYERLREEQEKAVEQTDENIKQWNKFRSDYVDLQSRLKSLPEKVKHDIMVPFGSKAFMPGQLVHCNEILVLLGDNWFAERSSTQACGIIDRRLKSIDKQLSDLTRQRDLLAPRIDVTGELCEMQQGTDHREIKEELTDDQDKLWREKHKASVKAHYAKQKKERENQKQEERTVTTDAELWARLDQLELAEFKAREMTAENLSDAEDSSNQLPERTQKHVTWAGNEQTESEDSFESSSGSYSEEEYSSDEAIESPRVINFSHGPSPDKTSEQESPNNNDQIESPRDIYRLFTNDGPRSILKASTAEIKEERLEKPLLTSSLAAFSGKIVERTPDPVIEEKDNLTTTENILAGQGPSQHKRMECKTDNPISNPPKKISKFKAQRMQAKQ